MTLGKSNLIGCLESCASQNQLINLITNTIDILKFAGFQFGDDNGSRAKTNSEEHYLYCGLTIEKIFLGEAKIYVVIYSEEGASKPSSTVSNITGKISVDTV